MSRERAYGSASPTLDAIVTAALEYIDAEGLDKLTMRGLATRMASYHTNLYRRVPSLDELLQHVTARIYQEAGTPPDPDGDARQELIDYAVRIRDAWLAHPHAVPLIQDPRHRAVAEVLDKTLGAFFALANDDAALLEATYEYTMVLYGAIFAGAPPPSGGRDDEPMSGAEALANIERYRKIVEANLASDESWSTMGDAHFRRAITRAIDRAGRTGS